MPKLLSTQNSAIHQLDEPFGDGKAEPGATVFPGGGAVGLAECLKETGGLFGRHPNAGVTDRELHLHTTLNLFRRVTVTSDFAMISEFHGVVDQVDQDLTKTQRIADEIRRQTCCGEAIKNSRFLS